VYCHTANGTIRAWQTTVDIIQPGPARASINPHHSGDAVLPGLKFLKALNFSQHE